MPASASQDALKDRDVDKKARESQAHVGSHAAGDCAAEVAFADSVRHEAPSAFPSCFLSGAQAWQPGQVFVCKSTSCRPGGRASF